METNEIFKELEKTSPGVTAVCSSQKIKGGVKTDIPCITVFVAKKKKLEELAASEVIPTEIDGRSTDVIEATFKALALLPTKKAKIRGAWVPGGDRTAKYRPAPGGVSCGHPDITAGTLGGWLFKGGLRCILSNNHVLANKNAASIGDATYQPGAFDGGTAADRIATLLDFIALNFAGGDNIVDCAVSQVDDLGDVDLQIADLTSEVISKGSAIVGMPTAKSGRTTAITEDGVTAIDWSGNVDYGDGQIAHFINQIYIETANYGAGGDSGSWILEKPELGEPVNLIGLLSAGTEEGYAIANPIADVFSELGLGFAPAYSYGDDVTFTTKPEAPTGLSATAISDTQIDVGWTKGDGAVNTVVRRKTGSYPTGVTDGEEAYNGPSPSFSDTGLDPSTTYYYRAWSYTDPQYSDDYSEDSATTMGAPPGVLPPTPTTESANNIEQTLATLNGVLTNDGGEACDCWFEYGEVGGAIYTTPEQSGKTTGALFLANLVDLTPDTRYHFRAVAKNTTGTTYGDDMYFVTESPALLEYSLVQQELLELLGS